MKKSLIILLSIAFVLQMAIFAYADVIFSDVKENDWFYDNIAQMVKLNMVNGYEDGTFKPLNSLKADEFIKMILIGMDYEVSKSDSTYWAENIIQKAEELKITDKSFISDYTKELTREQASRIIVNALSIKEQKPTDDNDSYIRLSIKDYNQISENYKDDVVKCYAWGIMQGDDQKRINPRATITRAEATAVVLRMINTEQRLDTNFEGRHISLADGRVPDLEATIMMITPRYQDKAVLEVTDIAYMLQTRINNNKDVNSIQIMFFDSNKTIRTEGYGDISNADKLLKVIGDKKDNSSLEQLSDIVKDYRDYQFSINIRDFDTKVPFSLNVSKNADYQSLGYKTYGEYFMNKYGENFKNVFAYLFEDGFDDAWKNFELAINCDDENGQVDTIINNRQLIISYDGDSVELSISLKK